MRKGVGSRVGYGGRIGGMARAGGGSEECEPLTSCVADSRASFLRWSYGFEGACVEYLPVVAGGLRATVGETYQ